MLNLNLQFKQFLRFCIVGATSAGLDMVIFYSVKFIATYQVAMIAGYLLSLLYNYLLTVFWTFSTKPTKSNAVGVIVAHLINLFVVRMGLMHFFVYILTFDPNIAYLPTLSISVVINFIMVNLVIKKCKA